MGGRSRWAVIVFCDARNLFRANIFIIRNHISIPMFISSKISFTKTKIFGQRLFYLLFYEGFDWSWMLFVQNIGPPGAPGADGKDGANGQNGVANNVKELESQVKMILKNSCRKLIGGWESLLTDHHLNFWSSSDEPFFYRQIKNFIP